MTIEMEVNGPVQTRQMSAEEFDNAFGAIPKVEIIPDLLVRGSGKERSLKALRTAEAIQNVGEFLKTQFDNRPFTYGYPIELPESLHLEPEDRTGVKTWMEENLPLGNDNYVWACVFNGKDSAFVLKIQPKRGRKVS